VTHHAPQPKLLALDTSTQRLVVALAVGDVTHGLDEEGGARASARLLPAVQELMQRAGLALRHLDAVAFARGPGAFTGLRAAASAAQGLAFGLGCPVLPIDSLMVVAEDARLQAIASSVHADPARDDAAWPDGTRVAVAMDARMGEIYAACWRWSQGTWHEEDAASLVDAEALSARWRELEPAVVAGTALDIHASKLEVPRGARAFTTMRHAPAALATLARRAWHAGHRVHPRDAQPLYVRDKVAFTTLERERMRGARAADAGEPSRAPTLEPAKSPGAS
jgi:tRNA threonylcarbamoyladenosine biosynthesis protein TsaB